MGTWAVPRTKIRVPVVDADLGYRSGVSGTGLAKMGLMHRQITGCRICGSEWLDVLLDLGTQFLTGVFPRSVDESLTKGPLTLVRCDECGLVQLLYSYERTELYGAHYGYRSSLNRKMVSHLEDKARMLLGAVDLRPDDVIVDIGSNDGTLLSFFSGKNLCLLGVDPSAARWRGGYPVDSRLIADFFSADLVRSAGRDVGARGAGHGGRDSWPKSGAWASPRFGPSRSSAIVS